MNTTTNEGVMNQTSCFITFDLDLAKGFLIIAHFP